MSKTAVILVAEGTEEIEAVVPGDVLERCGVNITYAGVGTLHPTGGHHVPLRADCLVEDLGEILFDALIIPGGAKGADAMAHAPIVGELVRRHHEAGKLIAAICAAPAIVLAPLGLLHGKHVTCFPGLERRFPPGVHACDTTVCVDGKLITSRAPGTAMEFSIKLAELLVGAPTALNVARHMLVPNY